MTIRAVIVDDEPLARRRLAELLAGVQDVELIAQCANGEEAIATLEESRPDLLFLDVQMPEIDGFEVLQAVGVDLVPVVIFVTAYDQFALRAFEARALDYLLKPFDDERFEIALQRARDLIRRPRPTDTERRLLALLQDASQHRGFMQRFVVPSGHRSIFIRTEDVDWIEAERNYIRLHVRGQRHLMRENLSRIEGSLDPSKFCRIHRSTIVNIDRIHAVESVTRGEYVVTLHDGTKLTSGRSFRERLHRVMGREG